MGPNADTATIGSNTSPEGFRGESTNDPDELRVILSTVRSNLWWAEQECKGLKKETTRSLLWTSFLLLLILVGFISIFITGWVDPEIWWMFPNLFIVPIVIILALLLILLNVGGPPKDLYEEKHARVRELKAELEFVQNKIKRIEDAQR